MAQSVRHWNLRGMLSTAVHVDYPDSTLQIPGLWNSFASPSLSVFQMGNGRNVLGHFPLSKVQLYQLYLYWLFRFFPCPNVLFSIERWRTYTGKRCCGVLFGDLSFVAAFGACCHIKMRRENRPSSKYRSSVMVNDEQKEDNYYILAPLLFRSSRNRVVVISCSKYSSRGHGAKNSFAPEVVPMVAALALLRSCHRLWCSALLLCFTERGSILPRLSSCIRT